ncbi:hypothetical protein [Leuconostoc falkenbergense]|uniref:hypothetical protein n=1 Tax=Leuconostoc falkenbergense TaxID=2766470 RepID=UPI0024A82579|nr:hypothetical protein [Leuconostoc falkenbergense]MDI6552909.1 hypothetical protein [Leuconostoc falkenbergense]
MNLKKKTGVTAATVLLLVLRASAVNAETANDQNNNKYPQMTNLEASNDDALINYANINYPRVSPRAVTMSEIARLKNSRIFEVVPIDPAIVQWRHSDIDYGLQNPTQPGYQYTYEYITNYIYHVDDPGFHNGFAISVADFLNIKDAELAAGATGYVQWTLSIRLLIEQGKVKMTDEIVCIPEKRDFTSARLSTSPAGEHGWVKYINKTPLIDDVPMPVPEAPSSEAPSSEAPSSEAPSSEAPSSEAPSSEAPSSEAPSSEAPSSEAPSSEAPSSEAPSSEAPSSEAPSSEAPSSEVPSSEAPSSEAPSSEAPSSEAPSSEAPSSEAPSSEAPSSEAPSSETPDSGGAQGPGSEVPSSEVPGAGDEDDSNGTDDNGDEDDSVSGGAQGPGTSAPSSDTRTAINLSVQTGNDAKQDKKDDSKKLPDTGEHRNNNAGVIVAAILAAGLRVVSVIQRKNKGN